jgi:hydroxymethylpyrimidine pyrophosphatase-like HAD family hydrolase
MVRRTIASGAWVSYATARSLHSARPATEGCGFQLPVIVYGGAFLVDPVTGTVLTGQTIEADAVEMVVECARAHKLPPLVYWLDDQGEDRISWELGTESPGILTYLSDRSGDPRFAPVTDNSSLRNSVFYVSIIGDRTALEALEVLADEVRALVGAEIHVNVQADTYHPEQIWLEITHRDAHKAAALRELASRLGATRVVSFGDNMIDLPMFEASDECYAVSNAIDPVKAAATAVIGSNDSDAVARWLQEHALGGPGG